MSKQYLAVSHPPFTNFTERLIVFCPEKEQAGTTGESLGGQSRLM
jgi:hypothetical protein